jgi:hypothetical protein
MNVNNAASRCDVDFWVNHLTNTEENERAELKQIRGLRADTVREALEEMQRQARINPRVKNFMYHADFNPRRDEVMTEEQRDRAIEIFEKERGIPANAPRIIMEHVKNGRKHWHVIWYRLDEQGRPFSDKHDAIIAHTAAAKIAAEFGFEQVISPLTRKPGTPRPERAPKPWEMLRGMKSQIDVRDVTAEVTDLRQQCASGIEFHAALETRGYILARGDKIIAGEPALMIIDPAADEHHLPRRIKGMNSKQVNEFMRDVDRAALPTIRQAKEQQEQRKIDRLEADRATVRDEIEWQEKVYAEAVKKEERERQFVEPERGTQPAAHEQGKPAFAEARILDAERHARLDDRTEGAALPDADAFREELEQRGVAFAVVSNDEAQSRYREANEITPKGAALTEGDVVLVTRQPLEHLRAGEWNTAPRVHALDQGTAQTYLAFLSIDKSKLKSIEATKDAIDADAEKRAAYWREIRLDRAIGQSNNAWTPAGKAAAMMDTGAKTAVKIMDTAPRAVSAALDIGIEVSGMVFSLLSFLDAPKSPRQQARDNYEGEKATAERNAEADAKIDFSQFEAARMQARQNEQQEQAARDRQRESERER